MSSVTGSPQQAVNQALAFQEAALQQEVAVRVQKNALDAAGAQGAAIVQLLEQATAIPPNVITETQVDARA